MARAKSFTNKLKDAASIQAVVPQFCDDRLPKMPEGLDQRAQRKWKELAPQLYAAGLLTHGDTTALYNLCIAWSTMLQAQERLDMPGMSVIIQRSNGSWAPNPLIRVRNDALLIVNRLCKEFAMTPSSRAGTDNAGAPGVLNGRAEDQLDEIVFHSKPTKLHVLPKAN
jgi:P27 family predicted phage terminase small subunit